MNIIASKNFNVVGSLLVGGETTAIDESKYSQLIDIFGEETLSKGVLLCTRDSDKLPKEPNRALRKGKVYRRFCDSARDIMRSKGFDDISVYFHAINNDSLLEIKQRLLGVVYVPTKVLCPTDYEPELLKIVDRVKPPHESISSSELISNVTKDMFLDELRNRLDLLTEKYEEYQKGDPHLRSAVFYHNDKFIKNVLVIIAPEVFIDMLNQEEWDFVEKAIYNINHMVRKVGGRLVLISEQPPVDIGLVEW